MPNIAGYTRDRNPLSHLANIGSPVTRMQKYIRISLLKHYKFEALNYSNTGVSVNNLN